MIRLILTLIFSLMSANVWAGIVCASTAPAEIGAQPPAANPQTLAWTPDAGSNRVAIVYVGFADATDADNTTATLSSSAGGTWTEYGTVNEEAGTVDLRTYIFYSTDFADGAQTLSATHSTTVTWGMMAAFTCTGVRTSNPWRGTAVTDTANGSATINVDVPSAVGDLVLDAITVLSPGAGETPAEDASQTEIFTVTVGNDNGDGGMSSKPGAAGNVTMQWTTVGTERWAMVGGSLVPARPGGAPIFFQ